MSEGGETQGEAGLSGSAEVTAEGDGSLSKAASYTPSVPVEINDSLANLNLNTGGVEEHPRAHEGDKVHEKETVQTIAQELGTHLKELEQKRKEKEATGETATTTQEEGQGSSSETTEASGVAETSQKATPATPEVLVKPVAPATPATPMAPSKPTPTAAPTPTPVGSTVKPVAKPALATIARPTIGGGGAKKPAYGTMQVRPTKGGAPTRNFNSLLRPKAKIAPPDIKPNTVLVIDNGSAFIKAGVSGEALPRVVIPPVIGTKTGNDKYLGFKALQDNLKVTNAIDINHGKVNWEYLGDIFEHIFYDELKVDPLNHPVLLTELPDMTRQNREKMCELMFEAFEVPSLYIANPAVMALFSQGMVTGVVVDCGNRMQIVPIIDGYEIENARSQLVPGNINEHLARLLTERGYYLTTQTQMNIVRRIKERACYVAVDFNKEMSMYSEGSVPEATFTMPDGHVLKIGNERFRAPESLFDPNLVGIDRQGLHKSIFECVNKCPIDYRTELYSKIVLSGGSTLFPGLSDRIKRELGLLLPVATQRRVNVIAPKNRKYSAWFGGSVFGTLGSYYDHCVWKDTFNEVGASCIHRDR